jgi:hypothetical protein
MLCAGAQVKHRKNLGEGIDGQPQPENLFGVAQSGAQFVQPEVWEPEMVEEVLVQGVCVLTSTEQKSS